MEVIHCNIQISKAAGNCGGGLQTDVHWQNGRGWQCRLTPDCPMKGQSILATMLDHCHWKPTAFDSKRKIKVVVLKTIRDKEGPKEGAWFLPSSKSARRLI